MGKADDSGLGDGFVQHQRAFHLGRAHAMARDVDDVIHPPGDPVVTVGIAASAVSSEVLALVGGEVGLLETLMIAEQGAHLARPGLADTQVALGGALQHFAVGVDNFRHYAEKRPRRRAGLELGGAGQRRDEDAAGLGLPPGIDDGATLLPDHVVVPLPGLGVDGFTHCAEQLETLAAGLFHQRVTLPHEGAQGGRGGVEDVYLVLIHHLPETTGIGVGGNALEHQSGRAVRKRAVDDIGMTRYPAHIGRAPVHVAVVAVEHVLVGHGGIQDVPAGGVEHTLWLAGGTRGIQDEQRILGIHGLRRAVAGSIGHEVVVPDVALLVPGNIPAGAFDGDYRVNIGTALQCLVGVGLERHRARATQALVGGDYDPAIRVEDAVFQGFWGKSAEDDGVHRANPRAGEYRHHDLGHHGHVDGDSVTLLDAPGFEHIGELAHVFMQLPVGDFFVGRRIVALPDDRYLVAPSRQVAVQTIVRNVQLGAFEPGDIGFVVIPVPDLGPGLEPVYEFFRLLGPEPLGVGDGPLVHLVVLVIVDVCISGNVRWDVVQLRLRHRSLLALIDCGPH